jgi:CubicO group peptidase (beta-lactamase class C family)
MGGSSGSGGSNKSRVAIALWVAVGVGGIAQRAAPAPPAVADAKPREVSALLRKPRESHDVPGMVGAIVGAGRLEAIGADGLRRRGGREAVTVDDRFHLGSCTKSMTATMLATLVEEERLSWDTTCAKAFPDLAPKMDPAWRDVTLAQLLTHRSGAPSSLDADGLWARLWKREGTPTDQRMDLVRSVTSKPPVHPPGSKYLYANAGFAIAGAMAERATGKSWEDLMRTRLFEPLGMSSAGFGAPGSTTSEAADQPWGHHVDGEPVRPGPNADNPPGIGPAGIVHAAIADWAKYALLHVRGEKDGGLGLPASAFRRMHEPPEGAEPPYAFGWIVARRDWGGRVLTHNGSNTMWYCVLWLSPEKDFGVLVACNRGGPEADKACDEAAWALIQDHLRPR